MALINNEIAVEELNKKVEIKVKLDQKKDLATFQVCPPNLFFLSFLQNCCCCSSHCYCWYCCFVVILVVVVLGGAFLSWLVL